MPLRKYVTAIEKALLAGNATEHTHRPALKELLEVAGRKVTATNEPRRERCGAPDYVVSRRTAHGPLTIGYVEAKDVGTSLDQVECSEQLARYRRFLSNLMLTDYLEFRWYVEGEPQGAARLARRGTDGKLKRDKTGAEAVMQLLTAFLEHEPAPVATPRELAERMARVTHMIRDIIIEALEGERASSTLSDLRRAFAQSLIPDLDRPEKVADFADMYAQTIAYGLFAARCNHPGARGTFRRLGAAAEIPKTNPFLRKLFETITGADLDDEPYAGFVDDLAALLGHADMGPILEHFGRRSRRQDPVVHFYETFLAAYDPRLRETRGVYYTPEPVVSYIVRSVDQILKTRFGCEQGLGDTSVCTYQREDAGGQQVEDTSPRVLIVDPACGTGTFLYAAVDHIREQFMVRGDAGMWSGYVKNHLLSRLFGFELLMAPYAVAHFKLGMQLAGQDLPSGGLREKWAYDFAGAERLSIYLTNTLEEAEQKAQREFHFVERLIGEEGAGAVRIKRDLPIMVIMGNPPYSGISANRGDWIDGLLKGRLPNGASVPGYYEVDGEPLGEKKVWLQDDYVKFIRWGQWRIERTGAGILALITNHGYLDNPTFRGMRQQLMRAFTDICILDLHGNVKRKERSPDGSKDENVFDIQQGVTMGIFIKDPQGKTPGTVRHFELWGPREHKYAVLSETDITTTPWATLTPTSPYYFFVPRDESQRSEYETGWKITDIMPVNTTGIVTARDHFVVDLDRETLLKRISDFRSRSISDDALRERYFAGRGSSKYAPGDTRGWKMPEARRRVRKDEKWKERVAQCSYRPFDTRSVYYVPWMVDWGRPEVMRHMRPQEGVGVHLCRQTVSERWGHVLATNQITDDCFVSNKTRERGYLFPLYLYPDPEEQGELFANGAERHVNLNPDLVEVVGRKLRMSFVADGTGDLTKTFSAEDVFHYIYGILHSPTYRERYAEFLRIDFPRVPITSNRRQFRRLCALGAELVSLHLLEAEILNRAVFKVGRVKDRLKIRYLVPGDDLVAKGHPRYVAPGEAEPGTAEPLKKGRVYISPHAPKSREKGQYFEGVAPEVWEFRIGGYQVCEKWLKERRGRKLTYDDLTHYQKVVVALQETIRLMDEIDTAVPGWPLK